MNRAYRFGLLTVFFWSTVATAFKLALQQMDTFQLLFYATLTSVIVLTGIVTWQSRWQFLGQQFLQYWKLTLAAGVMNPFVYYLVLFAAYDRLPAQVAQPINYTWAIVLALMSMVFLGQPVRRRDLLAGLICYAGVLVIATHGDLAGIGNIDLVGVGLAIVSTFIWAGYWILVIRDERDPVIAMCLNFLVALPLVALSCLLFSSFAVSLPGLAGGIYVGLFEMSLAFLCWSTALRSNDNAAKIGNLIFLSPFLSLVFIYFLLGESIYPATFVGLVLIVGGLLWQQRGD